MKSRRTTKTKVNEDKGPRTRNRTTKGSVDPVPKSRIRNSVPGSDSSSDEDDPVDNANGDGWGDQYYVTKRGGESFIEIAKKVGITPELLLRKNAGIMDHKGRPIRCRPKTKMSKGSTLWVPDGYWQ